MNLQGQEEKKTVIQVEALSLPEEVNVIEKEEVSAEEIKSLYEGFDNAWFGIHYSDGTYFSATFTKDTEDLLTMNLEKFNALKDFLKANGWDQNEKFEKAMRIQIDDAEFFIKRIQAGRERLRDEKIEKRMKEMSEKYLLKYPNEQKRWEEIPSLIYDASEKYIQLQGTDREMINSLIKDLLPCALVCCSETEDEMHEKMENFSQSKFLELFGSMMETFKEEGIFEKLKEIKNPF